MGPAEGALSRYFGTGSRSVGFDFSLVSDVHLWGASVSGGGSGPCIARVCRRERIFVELLTSDFKLQAYREGSK